MGICGAPRSRSFVAAHDQAQGKDIFCDAGAKGLPIGIAYKAFNCNSSPSLTTWPRVTASRRMTFTGSDEPSERGG